MKTGTITPISAAFPADVTRRAVDRVREVIDERQKELDQINGFVEENKALRTLVQRLPDELSHEIMVPFGKAAFFPGRLVHTNEFMVWLGEKYYVERTAKQTSEILQRRGKTLESKVQEMRITIKDLEAEASFFSRTAAEAAEGLVEIREDYDEDTAVVNSETERQFAGVEGNLMDSEEDPFDRLMSRLDELEKEEELAGTSDIAADDEEERPQGEHGALPDTAGKSLHNSLYNLGGVRISDEENTRSTLARPHEHIGWIPISNEDKTLSSSVATSSNTRKAFTGSVIERGFDSHEPASSVTDSVSKASKPVSRFKMQRGNQ